MARSAEGLPTKPKKKVKPKRKSRAAPPAEPESLKPPPLNISINKGHRYKPGNRFWEVRSSHGRKPIFQTPEILWNAAAEYFAWVEKNPLWETKLFAYEGQISSGEMPKLRIMTITSLCIFLDISTDTWALYKKRPEFIGTCRAIEEIVREQALAGASSGHLNAMIVARYLGLKDSINAELTGKGGGPIETITTEMDPKKASEVYKTLLSGK